jgi:hypothetical protein
VDAIIRAWKGKERLWRVYWLYHGLYGFALATAVSKTRLLSIPSITNAAYVFLIIYLIWVYVSIWRCAFNVERKAWGYVARGMVPVLILFAIGSFIYGLMENPLIKRSLECRHLILEDVARSGLTREIYGQQHPNVYEDCVHQKSKITE